MFERSQSSFVVCGKFWGKRRESEGIARYGTRPGGE
jgi:hypothetical protein